MEHINRYNQHPSDDRAQKVREAAQAAYDFCEEPWSKVGECKVSIIEREPSSGYIFGGGVVADTSREEFATHIATSDPKTILDLVQEREETLIFIYETAKKNARKQRMLTGNLTRAEKSLKVLQAQHWVEHPRQLAYSGCKDIWPCGSTLVISKYFEDKREITD